MPWVKSCLRLRSNLVCLCVSTEIGTTSASGPPATLAAHGCLTLLAGAMSLLSSMLFIGTPKVAPRPYWSGCPSWRHKLP